MNTTKAFTLIELLIVVAIIAILAAIAVPNFLEAQTRAKVTRVKADMRTVSVAIESYYVDHNRPPQDWQERFQTGAQPMGTHTAILGRQITTPVAYLTSLPEDPFTGRGSADLFSAQGTSFWYFRTPPTAQYSGGQNVAPPLFLTGQKGYTYVLESYGPERTRFKPGTTTQYTIPEVIGFGSPTFDLLVYDPTNGTISAGRIARTNKGIYEGADYD